jgi:hypothetical protein
VVALGGRLTSTVSAAKWRAPRRRRRGVIVTCICISDSAESRSTEDFDDRPCSTHGLGGRLRLHTSSS